MVAVVHVAVKPTIGVQFICRSVTNWNVQCVGYGRSDSEFNSNDGREHRLGLVIGPGQSMRMDARRLMSKTRLPSGR